MGVNLKSNGKYNKSPILNISIAQTIKWLREEFKEVSGRDLAAALTGNMQNLREFASKNREKDGSNESKLDYPYAVGAIADISLDSEKGGFNKGFGREKGITVNKDFTKKSATHLVIRPIKLGIGFVFNTDSQEHVIDLAHVLLMEAPKKAFQLSLGDFTVGVTLNIDPNLQIPEANFSSPGVAYQYQFVLTLETYIGYQGSINLIDSVVVKVKEGETDAYNREIYNGTYIDLVTNELNYLDFFSDETTPYEDK